MHAVPSGRYPYLRMISEFPYPELIEAAQPLEVEFGCGKAKYLIQRAGDHPERNFLAVDRVGKWMNIGKKRAEKHGLKNLKFIKADARQILIEYLLPGSVRAFHVYFPDPWPKKRHHKRRLITGELLRLLYDRLEDRGLVFLASDDLDYFEGMKEAATASGVPWTRQESRNRRLQAETLVKTNYEIKYGEAGRDLYYLELEKVCA